MPRELVLGNGNLLINFDKYMNIRDIYFPHVGMENHVSGHKCRMGVWVDGSFSWIDDSWERSLRYKDESLVTDVILKNGNLDLELHINDAVHHSKNVFLRRVVIKNLTRESREVRLFFSHDFHLYGSQIGCTALYDPSVGAVIHYKKNRYFLINGSFGGKGLYQYAAGSAEIGHVEGTWKDAEDGILSNNPIAHGSVDSTVSLRADVPAEGEATAHYWIAVGKNFPEVKRLNGEVVEDMPQHLIDETEVYHRSWVNKQDFNFADLPEKIVKMFKRSLLILRTQINNNGAIIAANDSDILRFNRDHYSYMWPRDGALVAYGLDKAGYFDITQGFFKFCNRVLTEHGYLLHKYNPDSSPASSWHPYIDEDGKPQLPIQEDETALVLYSLWNHYDQFRDLEFIKSLYKSFIEKAANFLVRYRDPKLKLPLPSYDLWEERRGILTFTTSAVYAGLIAASKFADLFGEEKDAEKYRNAAEEVKRAMQKYLYDEGEGRFLRMINVDGEGRIKKDFTIESSVYGIFEFGVLPADDPRVVKTMNAIKNRLWINTEVGGVARYENDHYHQVSKDIKNVPGNPWFICTMWLAEWYVAKAKSKEDLGDALEILEWVVDHASESGLLAEQANPYTNEPLSVSPLTWSHATYIIVVMKYLDKLNELGICLVCGSPKITHKH
ncbi:MAG: glycoside hydrolase family 15 protein [Candidatus Hydrothermarchaeales archaeon]